MVYRPHETGASADDILAGLLAGPAVERELTQLVVDTLQSPGVQDELRKLQLSVALWAAGGVAVGIFAGMWLWRRF